MSTEANKAAVRGFFAAIDAAQSMAPLDGFVAPSYVAYFPGTPPLDRDGTKGYGNVFFAACPGMRHTVEQVIGEGDQVAARLNISGSVTKPFVTPNGTIPPNGQPFDLPVMNWYRFEQGKMVEQRIAFDMMGFLQQIGAMPGPGR